LALELQELVEDLEGNVAFIKGGNQIVLDLR
jgi:hypothetical protein